MAISIFFSKVWPRLKKSPTKGVNEIKIKTSALVAETEEKYDAFQKEANRTHFQSLVSRLSL